MNQLSGRDRNNSRVHTRRLVATAALLGALLAGLVPAPHADARTTSESSAADYAVGRYELDEGMHLVDPHRVADFGLLRALTHAGLIDEYLDSATLDPRAAMLRVVDPSDGFAQTRGALIRALARSESAATKAKLAQAEIERWLEARPSHPALADTDAVAQTDRRVRHAVAHVHGPALRAASDNANEIATLIEYLHAYRRGETLAGVELKGVVFDAYLNGEAVTSTRDGCHTRWTLFAAIGSSESRHGTLHNAVVDPWGDPSRSLLGPLLDGGASKAANPAEATGNGFAVVKDSDGGLLDGNAQWDRAIGPMQFLPSTWRTWSADGDGDGWENPQNMYDAVAGAANLLCGLMVERGYDPHEFLLGYNGSGAYVRKVLAQAAEYETLFLPELHTVSESS